MGKHVDALKDKKLQKSQIRFQTAMFDPKTFKDPKLLETFRKEWSVLIPKEEIRTIAVGGTVEGGGNTVLPYVVIEKLIRKAKTRVIFNFCMCRDKEECKDYPQDLGCIMLGESMKDVHPEMARPASLEECLEHARRARERGLVHIIGQSAVDAEAMRVPLNYINICFCCECCCLAKMFRYTEKDVLPITKISGLTVTVSEEDCTGCATCEDRCIFQALEMKDGLAVIDSETCKGCGRCAEACPEDAISMRIENPDFVAQTLADVEKHYEFVP
jgi:Pyruvate/2-oxoacid:ferredoxin oxidoreductase delta subunit